jgi:hypothetical protein
VARCPRKESKQALAPGGRKGDSYLIGSLPASRAVSRIARFRHSAAPLLPVLKLRCNCRRELSTVCVLFSFAEYPVAPSLRSRSVCFGGVGCCGERYFSLSDALEEPWRYFDDPS